MNKFTILAIMPNFNGEELLEKSLPKLIDAMKVPQNGIIEIIVVDDGSIDESVNLLKKKFPEVKIIKHTVNRGFSSAVNTGVRGAKGDLILLINNDVLPNNDFLEHVQLDFNDKTMFAVSLHEKGYGYAKGSFADGYIQLAMGKEEDKKHSSFYVSGGSGVFRKNIWVELGGMDEKLLSPFYWEDIDLCYRALKRGYKLLWEPNGLVEHHHESTIGGMPKSKVARIRERNQLLMLWKNITSSNLIRKHIVGIFKRLLTHPGYIRVIFMALAKLGIVLQKRKREIKESKVSDEAVFARYA
jgi:GT2 family glycosyltransferase